ncbi:predicted protein [Botrytis cinerea T4]|uniref:Uncharacterized protein n=1 Tax=Botryotinia fuckeliana (strain T4) TaxID=999810 RepID=G2XTB3_BOTF4|nr:predicted protein [Botrytis cinerea T4]
MSRAFKIQKKKCGKILSSPNIFILGNMDMKFVARVRETRSTIEGKSKGNLWELEESDTWVRSTLATSEAVSYRIKPLAS